MKALTWQGVEDVRIEEVPDPRIEEPTDAIIRVTSTAICGSDLHLYALLGPFLEPGDILGHEAMGIVEEVGASVEHIRPGDRVVIPFNVSCGRCYMCTNGLYAQCETTQQRKHGTGAALFGYTKLYGSIPGGQAEYLRVPQAHFGPIPVGDGPDERYLFLSDVLPTAWQAVEFADIPEGGTVAVLGLGPIGQMCVRVARHRGARVIALDRVPERLQMARRHGAEILHSGEERDVVGTVRQMTDGRGPESVIDAVGMEAHGSPLVHVAHRAMNFLPDAVQGPVMQRAGVDRLAALYQAIDLVRRGGTISISGVYAGNLDPLPMFKLFDKGVQLRMGQAHVRRWTDDLMVLVDDPEDPLGVLDFTTHHLSLDEAPQAYDMFQHKRDGAIKVVLHP